MINYLKTAFTKPKEIYIGRNMKNSHFFSILFALMAVLTIFSLFEFYPAFNKMNQEITEVKQAIPEFTLEDNELSSETESFIYQTDTLFLYFDPENQMSTEVIDRNMNSVPVPVSVGLLHNELSLNLLGQSFSLPYEELTDFTTADLENVIDRFGQFSPGFIVLFLLFLFLFNAILYLVQFFPIVLFTNLISVYRKTGLRFYQTMKITLLATIPPIITLYAVNALLFSVYYQFELLIVTSVILYYMCITEMKNRISEKQQTEE